MRRREDAPSRRAGFGREAAHRLSLVIFVPIVWMMRQPPVSVPSAIAA